MAEDRSREDQNMKRRTIVVAIICDGIGRILLCKMPKDRGAYPGQWALPGGGIEDGETMWEALHREVGEEVGLELSSAVPWMFQDDTRKKLLANGEAILVYMIFLIFDCVARSDLTVKLNDEFESFAWVSPSELGKYDLNPATHDVFCMKGYLER